MERIVRVARSPDQAGGEADSGAAIESGRLTIRGDDSGALRRLVHVGPKAVTVATG
jgi:hypothetical protein